MAEPIICTFTFEGPERVVYRDTKEGVNHPIALGAKDLVYETLLALSWYVENTPEQACEPQLLQVLGKHLFEFLFQDRSEHGKVAAERFKSHCDTDGAHVHVNLLFEPAARRYAQLPWEFLMVRGPRTDRFLAAIERVSVTLTRHLPTQRLIARCDDVLKVLVHVSSPANQPAIAYQNLQIRLDKLRADAGGRFEYRLEKDAPLAKIRSDLAEFQPHVFHFSGHGERDALWLAQRDRGPVLETLAKIRDSRTPFGFGERVDDESFKASIEGIAQLFAKDPVPQLVILDACNSEWSWLSEMLPGVAHQLVETVPAVIAMRYPISNQAAEEFSMALYDAILLGQPLDEAVQRARNGLRLPDADTATARWSSRAFGTPVLYLKESRAICGPLISPPQSEPPAGAPSVKPRACPRCGEAGLFVGKRCSKCGIYFVCRNPRCLSRYTEAQIAHLHFCPNCDQEYGDVWPWPPAQERVTPGPRPPSLVPLPGGEPDALEDPGRAS